jgi:transcriptional regulator with XRE-family HTH domain
MSNEMVARQVGRLVQAVRGRARMSQARLADRAGTTQQWVSRVERGEVDLRLSDAERLFAAARARLIVRVAGSGDEPVDDPDLLRDDEVAEDVLRDELTAFLHVRRLLGTVPYLVGGRFAALAQGMRVRPYRLDLIVAEADVEAVTQALGMTGAMRWSDRWQDFSSFDMELARAGERRWRIGGLYEMAFDVVPELAAGLTVGLAKHSATERSRVDLPLTVVPLTVLLREDTDVAELQERLAA